MFTYFFPGYKDPEGTAVTLSIMSGLDSSFMTYDDVSKQIVMEPKEGGSYTINARLTDGDKEFKIY